MSGVLVIRTLRDGRGRCKYNVKKKLIIKVQVVLVISYTVHNYTVP